MATYCVIGKSLGHTLSPMIHRMLGLGAYTVEEIPDVGALYEFVKSRRYSGYNVTIPYKRDIMDMLDRVDGEVLEVGAVNTVVDEGGELVGYNTDVGGMGFAMDRGGISLFGKNVLILGSGGTSHTAQYLAKKRGAASISVVSRSGDINYKNCYDLVDTEIIINTTPVGMTPNSYAAPIDVRRFAHLEGVFDAIYNPLTTLLVSEARKLNIPAVNGLGMLVEQARLAEELFLKAAGKGRIPQENSIQICKTLSKERKNIVLIGMAGSGKSAIGRRLAKALGREFFDTDRMVVSAHGDIPRIFETEGEAAFRRYEAAAVKIACQGMGRVIAVGGGAVLNEENVFYMQSNGALIQIVRAARELATNGRPLSGDPDEAARLYEKRRPIYDRLSDGIVNNDGDLNTAVERARSLWRTIQEEL